MRVSAVDGMVFASRVQMPTDPEPISRFWDAADCVDEAQRAGRAARQNYKHRQPKTAPLCEYLPVPTLILSPTLATAKCLIISWPS